MDGSEDTESLPAAVLSGAPIELQARTVRYVTQDLNISHFNALNHDAASTNRPSPPHSLAPGVPTIGEWIGTFWRRGTDGRTR